MLGIQHPIFLAPMAGVSTPQLAAEVSNAGGLGALGLGACATAEQCRQQILATQALTDKPFQVNFFCHNTPQQYDTTTTESWLNHLSPHFAHYNTSVPTTLNCIYPSFVDTDDFLQVVLDTKVKVVSFHFGLPRIDQLECLKAAGVITMATATNVSEGRMIQSAGVDIVVAQGVEAGGHRGTFDPTSDSCMTTAQLTTALTTYLDPTTHVIAAGGIMNGAHVVELMSPKHGAHGVQLGTFFLKSPSSAISPAYRRILSQQDAPLITQITAVISGRPARGVVNKWMLEVDTVNRPKTPGYPHTYDVGKQLAAAAGKCGDDGYTVAWAGVNVGMIREGESAQALMEVLLEEITEAQQQQQQQATTQQTKE